MTDPNDSIEIFPLDIEGDLNPLTQIMKSAFDNDSRRFGNKPESGDPKENAT